MTTNLLPLGVSGIGPIRSMPMHLTPHLWLDRDGMKNTRSFLKLIVVSLAPLTCVDLNDARLVSSIIMRTIIIGIYLKPVMDSHI